MNDYLQHYGIHGMKWGVRRYQNDDGSLTAAGKERYGGQREYQGSGFRRALTGETVVARLRAPNGQRAVLTATRNAQISAKAREKADRAAFKAEEARFRGNDKKAAKMEAKQEKYANRAEAFRKLDLDRIAYDKHTSTGKMIAQNIATGGWAMGEIYRDNRAMGVNSGKAYVNTMLGFGYTKQVEKHYRNAE